MFHVLLGHLLQLQDSLRSFWIYTLPFVVAKETLDPRIISTSALAVHADSNGFFGLDTVNIGFCCELTSLIAVHDFRRPVSLYCLFNGPNDKVSLHRVTHGPSDD